jgi:hypothetical protein
MVGRPARSQAVPITGPVRLNARRKASEFSRPRGSPVRLQAGWQFARRSIPSSPPVATSLRGPKDETGALSIALQGWRGQFVKNRRLALICSALGHRDRGEASARDRGCTHAEVNPAAAAVLRLATAPAAARNNDRQNRTNA